MEVVLCLDDDNDNGEDDQFSDNDGNDDHGDSDANGDHGDHGDDNEDDGAARCLPGRWKV